MRIGARKFEAIWCVLRQGIHICFAVALHAGQRRSAGSACRSTCGVPRLLQRRQEWS